MGRTLEPRLRTLLATLCVALTFVFAGASAASVVDAAQHAAHVPHHHGLHLSFSMADDGHHDGDHHHHDDGDHDGDHQGHGAPGDHQTGVGHHHADAPVGAPAGHVETDVTVALVGPILRIEPSMGAKGVRPGGLERPPKHA